MRRCPLPLSACLFLIWLPAGCVADVSGLPSSGADAASTPPGSGADAAPPGPPVADAGPSGSPDALDFACREPDADVPSGEHNAGESCRDCHDGTGEAPLWTLAGTLYVDGSGRDPLPGATITVEDADGESFDLVTAENGNFWTERSIAYPVHVVASSCPDVAAMGGAIPAPASCNASGCHSGGGTGPGRMHLP